MEAGGRLGGPGLSMEAGQRSTLDLSMESGGLGGLDLSMDAPGYSMEPGGPDLPMERRRPGGPSEPGLAMEASDLSMEPGGLGSPGLPMEVGGPRSSGSASERLPPWNARATAWLEQIGEGIEEVRLQHADLHLLILSLRRRVAQSAVDVERLQALRPPRAS